MSGAMKINNYQRPVNLLEISQKGKQQHEVKSTDSGSFKEMFTRELSSDRSVQFSKHASQRLHSRNIEFNTQKMEQIADAVDRADVKGSKETLILTDDAALVVSVKNRTVITVFDRDNLRDGIVTSIDSAVII